MRVFAMNVLMLAVLCPGLAHGEQSKYLNLGIEVSAVQHFSIRTSLVHTDNLNDRSLAKDVPKFWKGAYARLDLDIQNPSAVLGLGISSKIPLIGVEGGLVMASAADKSLAIGTEATVLLTLGLFGFHHRVGYIQDEGGIWKTDFGLRFQVPVWSNHD